jgi:hypothetical protein
VIAWTSDATNRWSPSWLDGQQYFEPFWAQVVKRTIRPPEDPNRSVLVSITADQASITLDAESGAEGATDRQYVNFLPVTAAVVDPQGVPREISLPQVAPGQYQATLAVPTDGVYTLQVTESDASGAQTTQSSGFVVPYSPEYRDLGTNDVLLTALAGLTSGKSIQNPAEALAHDLPAVGAARAIWSYLLVLVAIVVVLDIGVRRVRFSAYEARASYQVLRKRLGYVDERPPAAIEKSPGTPLIPLASDTSWVSSVAPVAAPVISRSQQLLAAKRRAAKR